MKIIGFVGISGSGKSFRALEIAAEHGMKYIIDDGLLISESRVIAGRSAKKEATKLASVRCALFFDKDLAKEVQRAIEEENPPGILVLGTSKEMIEKITKTLNLPAAEKYIEISDIATDEEIEKARNVRREQGKHVIPVPTFEIKKDFSGYWMDALKKITKGSKSEAPTEKSVVRPTFSYMGSFEISNAVLVQICTHEAKLAENVSKVMSCSVYQEEDGVSIKIGIAAVYGVPLQQLGRNVIKRIHKAIEGNTAINVSNVAVKIKTLV